MNQRIQERWKFGISRYRKPLERSEESNIAKLFQERDLRAKVASDSGSLVEASERLGHADTAITQRVYRPEPVRVQLLKKGGKT